MTRSIFILFLHLFCLVSSGQTKESILLKINTISQAESFIKTNPNIDARVFEIKSADDINEIISPLFKKKAGFTFRIDNAMYKVLNLDSTLSFRANYIYINGQQFSKKQVDSLRQEIISKYKAGVSFFELVQMFNMDGNPNGDTNWFAEGTMVKEFEDAVRKHKKNDIFTVDSPDQNWYHVVLKTFDDSFIKTVTIFRIQ